MMRWIHTLSVAVVTMLVASAATAATLASPQEDRRAKEAVPPAGKALVYIYRADERGAEPTVLLNGKPAGQLAPRTFVMAAVNPGKLEVRTRQPDAPPLTLRCQDGRIYFVRLSLEAGGVPQLRAVPYATGRQETHRARLVRGAAAEPSPPSAARSGFNLILKVGTRTLGEDVQSIVASNSVGVPTSYQLTFDDSASVLGLEGEWYMANGWAFGGELLIHEHDYRNAPVAVAGSGSMTVTSVLVNAKKYFRPGHTVQPYVGAGVGIAIADLSGDLYGSATGLAVQAMGGVAFRWQHLGLYTEVKFQMADTSDVDVSGTGLLAGVSFQF